MTDSVFKKVDGLLTDEFRHTHAALFDKHELHEAIVRALGRAERSLTRNELMKHTSLASGGSVTRTPNELIQSEFVHENPPRDNQGKQTVYPLADESSLFYLNWIETNRSSGKSLVRQRGVAAESGEPNTTPPGPVTLSKDCV